MNYCRYNNCQVENLNRYHGGNNSGSSSTMKKKNLNKFNNISRTNFSINGIGNVNNIYNFIGNQNSGISTSSRTQSCKVHDTTRKISVKNSFALQQTRSIENGLKCNRENSKDCYNISNNKFNLNINDNRIENLLNEYNHVKSKEDYENIKIECNKNVCDYKNSSTHGRLRSLTAKKTYAKDTVKVKDYSEYIRTLSKRSNRCNKEEC